MQNILYRYLTPVPLPLPTSTLHIYTVRSVFVGVMYRTLRVLNIHAIWLKIIT